MRISLYINDSVSDKFENLFKPYDFTDLDIMLREINDIISTKNKYKKDEYYFSGKNACLLSSKTTITDIVNNF